MGKSRTNTAKLKGGNGKSGNGKTGDAESESNISGKTPRAPARLSARSRAVWQREAREVYQLGALNTADLGAFGLLCDIWSEYDEVNDQIEAMAKDEGGATPYVIEGARGHLTKNTLQRQREHLRKELWVLLDAFGMNPKARARMQKPPEEDLSAYYAQFGIVV